VFSALKQLKKALTHAVEKHQHERKESKGHADELLVDHFMAAHKKNMDAVVGECLTYIATGISRTASCELFIKSNQIKSNDTLLS
jgi:hypothetical protein